MKEESCSRLWDGWTTPGEVELEDHCELEMSISLLKSQRGTEELPKCVEAKDICKKGHSVQDRLDSGPGPEVEVESARSWGPQCELAVMNRFTNGGLNFTLRRH